MTVCVIMKFWNEEQLLPLTLEQFRESRIDCLNLFDDGSTDESYSVASEIISGFPFRTSLIRGSESHDRYFPADVHEPESVLLNRMIDSAKDYDWCIQVDADEVFCHWYFIPWLTSLIPNITAVRVPFFHLVDKIDNFILTMPGLTYQLFPDYHVRIFRPQCWKFPEQAGLDAIIKPVMRGHMVNMDWGGILHMHYLDATRRGLRNGNERSEDGDKQAAFRQDKCTYGTVPDALIPDRLVDWYNAAKIKW